MKHIFWTLLVVFVSPLASAAESCPDFSGTYISPDWPWWQPLVIVQRDCGQIEIEHNTEHEDHNLRLLAKTDRRAYVKTKKGDVPVTENTRGYHYSLFWKDQLVYQIHTGLKKTCQGKYKFYGEICQKSRFTFKLDKNGNLTVSQKGFKTEVRRSKFGNGKTVYKDGSMKLVRVE